VAREDAQLDESVRRNERPSLTSRCIDWYHEGESRTVEVDGLRITVRFIGRKGRRGRIAIEAPAGAVFQASEQQSM
jgi:hypothetical protein